MEKYIQVDIEKCTGCRTCEVSCSLKTTGQSNPARSRIKVIRFEETGAYHNYVPMVCQQCSTPLCMEACAVNAISKNEETGAMVVDQDACVGCRVCSIACPIGGISVDPVTEVAYKCDLCDGDPECVKCCDAEAIKYVSKDLMDISLKRSKSDKVMELFTLMRQSR